MSKLGTQLKRMASLTHNHALPKDSPKPRKVVALRKKSTRPTVSQYQHILLTKAEHYVFAICGLGFHRKCAKTIVPDGTHDVLVKHCDCPCHSVGKSQRPAKPQPIATTQSVAFRYVHKHGGSGPKPMEVGRPNTAMKTKPKKLNGLAAVVAKYAADIERGKQIQMSCGGMSDRDARRITSRITKGD